MTTQFCEKCKHSHPGRVCDYDDQGDCAETLETGPEAAEQPVPAETGQKPKPVRDRR